MKHLLKKWLYFSNRLVQQYRKTKITYITCSGNTDGAGAQAHAILSTILFADLYHLQYVHTPFRQIEHKPSDRVDWESCWEEFFGLGEGQVNVLSVSSTIKRTSPLKHPLFLWKKGFTLYTVRNCHESTDIKVEEYIRLQGRLKTRFFEKHRDVLQRRPAAVKRIAIHIRRGDVTLHNYRSRFTPVTDILPVLSDITGVLAANGISYQIDVYSQGSEEDFRNLSDFQPCFHLNKNEQETLLGLVSADILVMAKSSFSYMAAFYSDGLVFYDDFWHPPLPTWTSIHARMNIRRRKLETFIKENNASTGASFTIRQTLT